MNFYFLLEDEKSFLKVMPLWLQYMNFGYRRVADIHEVQENNYILQSGQGVTQLITEVLFDTIDTILLNPGCWGVADYIQKKLMKSLIFFHIITIIILKNVIRKK